MSKDMCDEKMKNIWRLSKMKIPCNLRNCTCLITQQSTQNPKVIIIGGSNDRWPVFEEYFEFFLFDIMGKHSFYRFMIDYKQVMSHLFIYFFVLFCV